MSAHSMIILLNEARQSDGGPAELSRQIHFQYRLQQVWLQAGHPKPVSEEFSLWIEESLDL